MTATTIDLPLSFAPPASFVANAARAKEHRQLLMDAVTKALPTAPESLEIAREGQDLLDDLEGMRTVDTVPYGTTETDAARTARRETRLAPYIEFAAERLGLSRHELNLLVPGAWHANVYFPFDERCAEEAIRWSIISRYARHLEIPLGGAGRYRVPLAKKTLRAFADEIRKHFGRWNVGGVKTGMFVRYGPSPVPSLPRKVDAGQVAEALAMTVSTDETRKYINEVWNSGAVSVGTDGRRCTILAGSIGIGEVAYKAKFGRNVPDWKEVVPKHVGFKDGRFLFSVDSTAVIDTADFYSLVAQARGAGCLTVDLHLVGGSVGISGSNREDACKYSSPGVTDETEPLIHLFLGYLLDMVKQARMLGLAQVSMVVTDPCAPVTFLFGDLGVAVLMPIRVS